jgi:hypothetical protein
LGSSLTLTGSRFQGISEASGGDTQSSPADYPLVQLLSLGNQQTSFLPAMSWSQTSFTSGLVPATAFPPGYALLSMFVNGIPSTSEIVDVVAGPGHPPEWRNPLKMANGSFQSSFDYYPGADFRVLATTNLNLPLTDWTVLGGVTEVSPGQYQFTDLAATNFPQRFYRLSARVGTIYIGNNLTVTNGGSDGVPPLVILGQYSPAGPLATSTLTLPTGTVQDVKFYGQNYNFTLYALSIVANGPNPNEQTFQVVASESFSGSVSILGIQTLPASGFSVNAGDFLAFAGTGPYYPQIPDDAVNSDATYENSLDPDSDTATPPGGPGSVLTVGLNPDPSAIYEYISDAFGNQGRIYCIGVDVSVP